MRSLPLVAVLRSVSLARAACHGLYALGPKDVSGTPTVYAMTHKAPDPLLVGCYVRSSPSEYNRPNKYEYCLVEQGDRYALLYSVMDGKSLATFKDWTDAVSDGEAFAADYDGSRYFVRDGQVWQTTTTGGPHRMLRMR